MVWYGGLLGRRLLLATLPRLCYTFHYESHGGERADGWWVGWCSASTMNQGPRIFQFSSSNSRHFDVRLFCLLLFLRGKGREATGVFLCFPWNARRKYLCGTMPRAKGDDVSFLTAAEFAGCLCLSLAISTNLRLS